MTGQNQRHAPASSQVGTRPVLREEVVVGRDIIELLSSGMYTDPLTIFREYVQNSADAVDRARAEGLLHQDEGTVSVDFDQSLRTIRIRDDGIGLAKDEFIRRLASLGASKKRGLGERGFRGVGRLSGLAYAQEVVFRSRSAGASCVLEMHWDCRRLRTLLRVTDGPADLADLLSAVVTYRETDAEDVPPRFFEVELIGVARLRGDRLMNPALVANYLAQVAPVPFDDAFRWGGELQAVLGAAGVRLGNLKLQVGGEKVVRPHRDALEVAPGREVKFDEVEFLEIVGTDDRLAAVGWLLHHPYEGALPQASLVNGFRARVGNIQVGDHHLLEELFAEPRFNAWTVGEIHIVDPRIVPNGRRDGFEQDAQFSNFANRLTPTARAIGQRCRTSSSKRKLIRDVEATLDRARTAVVSVRQNALGKGARASHLATASREIEWLSCLCDRLERLGGERHVETRHSAECLRGEIEGLGAPQRLADPFADIPRGQRRGYEHVIELIYECSPDRAAAARLVDQILARLHPLQGAD